jgi:hypothetical protein
MDKPKEPLRKGEWHDIILATTALIYRLSWPLIDAAYAPPTCHHPGHNALYSLGTKFLFAYIGLSCCLRVFRAVLSLRRTSSTTIACRSRDGVADRLLWCSVNVLCLLVTSINAVAGWRWAGGAVEEYFTRGLGMRERSRVHRGAATGCLLLLSVGVVALLGVCWVSIVGDWWAVGNEWLCLRREEEERKDGMEETEKQGLAGDVEEMGGLRENVSDWKS